MKSYHHVRAALVSAFLALLIPVEAPGQTFNLANDFRNALNPDGAWSFRKDATLLPFRTNWIGNQNAYAFADAGPGHIPSVWQVPAVGYLPDANEGDILLHSWDSLNGATFGVGNVAWTAPAAGVVTITGATWMPRDIMRSVVWDLRHNATVLTSGTLFSGDPYSRASPMAFATGSGGPGVLTNIAVAAGDTIAYELGTIGMFGDFAAIDWTISYAPGSYTPLYQVNQANASFDLNGVHGHALAPAIVTRLADNVATFGAVTANFGSPLTGSPWDLAFTGGPLVPATGPGFVTAGGQIVNIDFADPSLVFLNNFVFTTPFPGNFSVPFAPGAPFDGSTQFVVLDPSQIDFFSLSQPVAFHVVYAP